MDTNIGSGRIAPEPDQHAAPPLTRYDKPICHRFGAACDVIVIDEDMEAVALWIAGNTPFDRLYFDGKDRRLHVSFENVCFKRFDMCDGAFTPRSNLAAEARVPRYQQL